MSGFVCIVGLQGPFQVLKLHRSGRVDDQADLQLVRHQQNAVHFQLKAGAFRLRRHVDAFGVLHDEQGRFLAVFRAVQNGVDQQLLELIALLKSGVGNLNADAFVVLIAFQRNQHSFLPLVYEIGLGVQQVLVHAARPGIRAGDGEPLSGKLCVQQFYAAVGNGGFVK